MPLTKKGSKKSLFSKFASFFKKPNSKRVIVIRKDDLIDGERSQASLREIYARTGDTVKFV